MGRPSKSRTSHWINFSVVGQMPFLDFLMEKSPVMCIGLPNLGNITRNAGTLKPPFPPLTHPELRSTPWKDAQRARISLILSFYSGASLLSVLRQGSQFQPKGPGLPLALPERQENAPRPRRRRYYNGIPAGDPACRSQAPQISLSVRYSTMPCATQRCTSSWRLRSSPTTSANLRHTMQLVHCHVGKNSSHILRSVPDSAKCTDSRQNISRSRSRRPRSHEDNSRRVHAPTALRALIWAYSPRRIVRPTQHASVSTHRWRAATSASGGQDVNEPRPERWSGALPSRATISGCGCLMLVT